MSLQIFAIGVVALSSFLSIQADQFSDSRPVVKQATPPVYPAIAMSRKAEGRVAVVVEIEDSGLVISAKATEGNKLLYVAAEQAAKRWRFEMVNKDAGLRVTKLLFTFKICARTVPENERQPVFKPPYEIEVCAVQPELVFTPNIDPPSKRNTRHNE
jgi:TonB family protein